MAEFVAPVASSDVVGGVDLGALLEESATLPGSSASALELERFGWGPMCKQNFLAVACPVSGGDRIPRLECVSTDDRGRLVFDVFMPAALGGARVEGLRSALLEHRSGVQSVSVRGLGDPGRFRFVLSTVALPGVFRWDGSLLSGDPERVVYGLLVSGPLCVHDRGRDPHSLIVGQSGSGKTVAMRMTAMQDVLLGNVGMIWTPTVGDADLELFGECDGWSVYGGTDEEAILERGRAAQLVLAEFDRRMKAKVGTHYDGPWFRLQADELGYVASVKKTDSDEAKEAKGLVNHTIQLLAEQGRKLRMGVDLGMQKPRVANFGGDGAILDELGFRYAIRTLPATFQSKVFPLDGPEQPAEVKRVLSGSDTPVGRAVVLGAADVPDDPWAEVDRTSVQGVWLTVEETRQVLGLDDVPEVRGPVIEVLEAPPLVDDGDRLDAELDALDLELQQLVDGFA